ncbi:MAG: flippase [Halorhabdus sp.]
MTKRIDQAIRDVIKSAGVVSVGLFLEVFVAFLAQWLAAQYLPVSSFGGLVTGTAILNIGAVVGCLGLDEGLTRYLPRWEEDRGRQLIQSTYLITLIVSVVLGLLVSLNAKFIATRVFGDSSVAVSIRIFGAFIPASAFTRIALGGIRGQQNSRYTVYVKSLLHPTTRFLLVSGAVVFGLAQMGYAFAYTMPYVVTAIVGTYLFYRTVPTALKNLTLKPNFFREVLGYSLPFVLSGATGFLFRSVDIFLVLYFIDSNAVGNYGVAYAVGRLMLLFSTVFNYIGAPLASELEADRGKSAMLRIHYSIVRWMVILSLPALVPLVLFPTEFISIVYRPRYAAGGSALAVLALGFAVHNIGSTQGSLLRALGSSKQIAFNSGIGAAINIGLNLLLIPGFEPLGIPKLGILGAAIATSVSYVAIDLLMAGELYVALGGIPISRVIVAPIGIAAGLFGGLYTIHTAIPGTFLWIVTTSVVFALIYWSAVLLTQGFNDEDVLIIESAQEKYGIEHPILDVALRWFS